MKNVIIVGGGASGIACALTIASTSPEVKITMLERLDRVGKKILATGNGRCNLSNENASPAFYYGQDKKALAEIMNGMTSDVVVDFFKRIGLYCCSEEGGRIYPYCKQAAMVMDILLVELLRHKNIKIVCGYEVKSIEGRQGNFKVICKEDKTFRADQVVIASGGKAQQKLGSNGTGFDLAKKTGHKVAPLYPCLVAFKSSSNFLIGLKGIRTYAKVSLFSDNTLLMEDKGELQLTDYGLSGIPSMQLSCCYNMNINRDNCKIVVDLLPEWSLKEVELLLKNRIKHYPNNTLETYGLGLMNKKIVYAIMKQCGIAPLSRKVNTLTQREVAVLSHNLKGWEFKIDGTLSWDAAQVTGGGVYLSEINNMTMESIHVKGMYYIGEVLDSVGECGGYNLHWAWITGIKAGIHISS